MQKIAEILKSNISLTPAVVCFLVKDDKILLGLRKKVSNDLGENLISGIGGKVGDHEEFKNETADQALIREVKEEINVTVTSYKNMGRVRFFFPHKPKWNQDVIIYIVDKWKGEPTETEPIKPIWYDINELPVAQMWADNAFWIYKILKGGKVDMAFLYSEDNKIAEHIEL